MSWDFRTQRGPWRILPQCPSATHNSLSAARGPAKGVRCVCPRAVALFRKRSPGGYRSIGIPWRINEDCIADRHNIPVAWIGAKGEVACTCPASVDYMRKHRGHSSDRSRKWKQAKKEERTYTVALTESLSRTMPDLSRGLCRRPENLDIFDAAFDDAEASRARAKAICHSCPALLECDAWVLRDEFPAGDWGGVYGGRDVYDRRNQWQPPRPLISMERKSIEARLQEAEAAQEKRTEVRAAPYARGGLGGIKAGGYRWSR